MLELNKIYNCDCLEGIKQLDDNSIDCVMTSPPYADVKDYGVYKGIKCERYVDWIMPIINEIDRIIKDNGVFILNIDDKVIDGFRHPYIYELIYKITKETNFKLYERLFWDKGKYLPYHNRFGNRIEYIFIFAKAIPRINFNELRLDYDKKSIARMKKPIKKRFNRNEKNNNTSEYKDWSNNINGCMPSTLIQIGSETQRVADNHFAVYPLELVEYFLRGFTTSNDIVLDPFIGSGTTAVACAKLNRNYIGFDLNPEYCQIAEKRLEKYKGQRRLA